MPRPRLGKGKADFLWTLASQYGRIVLQGAAFVALARLLQADGYGVLSGISAFVAIAVPFSGAGGASLILRHVSRDSSKVSHWLGRAFVLLAITSPLLALIVFVTGSSALGKSFHAGILWGFFISEAVMMRIPDIVALTFQGVDRLDLSARTNLTAGALRLASVGIVLVFPPLRTAEWYVAVYVVTSSVSALLSLFSLRRYLDTAAFTMPTSKEISIGLREGFPFCLGLASRSIYGDIDKTMLARMTTTQITGVYSAAYRVVNMAFVPAQSLIASITVKLLRSSHHGVKATVSTALRIYPHLFSYSVLVGIVLWFCAPLAQFVVGPSYTFVADVLRALAWMPVIQVTHFLAGDTLMALDRQGARSACQLITALINVLLNLALISRTSWRGAVVASYLSEGFLAVSLIVILVLALRSEMISSKPQQLAA